MKRETTIDILSATGNKLGEVVIQHEDTVEPEQLAASARLAIGAFRVGGYDGPTFTNDDLSDWEA